MPSGSVHPISCKLTTESALVLLPTAALRDAGGNLHGRLVAPCAQQQVRSPADDTNVVGGVATPGVNPVDARSVRPRCSTVSECLQAEGNPAQQAEVTLSVHCRQRPARQIFLALQSLSPRARFGRSRRLGKVSLELRQPFLLSLEPRAICLSCNRTQALVAVAPPLRPSCFLTRSEHRLETLVLIMLAGKLAPATSPL